MIRAACGRSAVAVLALSCVAASATAADALPRWELGAGVVGLGAPDYRGSDHRRPYVLPVPTFSYRSERFQADHERLRGFLVRSDKVDVELSASGSVPVDSDKNPAREGMPDLDPTLEIGPSLNVRLSQTPARTLWLRLPVRAIIASDFRSVDGAGVVANPNLNLDVRLADGWRLGFVAGVLFGSRRNHGYFYDVAAEHARPGRPAYQAPGGFSGTQLLASVSRRWGDWFAGGFVRADFVGGTAFESSPLVVRSSNVTWGFAVTRVLRSSRETIVVPD